MKTRQWCRGNLGQLAKGFEMVKMLRTTNGIAEKLRINGVNRYKSKRIANCIVNAKISYSISSSISNSGSFQYCREVGAYRLSVKAGLIELPVVARIINDGASIKGVCKLISILSKMPQ